MPFLCVLESVLSSAVGFIILKKIFIQESHNVPLTNFYVEMGAALANGSCVMAPMIVEMAVMRALPKTAVSCLIPTSVWVLTIDFQVNFKKQQMYL